MSHQNKKKDCQQSHHPHTSKNHEKDNNPKSKRRKQDRHRRKDPVDTEDDEVVEVPLSRSQSEAENLNLTDAPPTNHERVAATDEQNSIKERLGTPSHSLASGAGASTQPFAPPKLVRREYHSYFETIEGSSEYEER